MQRINATHWQKIHRVVNSMGFTKFMRVSGSATIIVAPTKKKPKKQKKKKNKKTKEKT